MNKEQRSSYFSDWVVGFSDGLVIPFAWMTALFVFGISGNQLLLWSGSGVVVVGMAMALSAYYSGKESTRFDFLSWMSREDPDWANKYLGNIPSNHSEVEEWDELPEPLMPIAAARVGLFFILGAVIPFIPYVFLPSSESALYWSAGLTLGALGVFGMIKARMTGQRPISLAAFMIIKGVVAGLAAYLFAQLF